MKLAPLLQQFRAKKILVAGDFVLDRYVFGKTARISPEAPVPVLHVASEDERAGGAGNVVLNLVSLGMQVTALGRVGQDAAGVGIEASLRREGVATQFFFDPSYHTSVKTRLIAQSQQLIRFDREELHGPNEALEAEILEALPKIVPGHDLIAISDYAKGFLTRKILRVLIDLARTHKIPVIADPKGTDFSKYAGVTVLKPNLGEAYAAANMAPGSNLDNTARAIFAKTAVDVLMVTRSEAGISLFYPDGASEHHPVQAKTIRDVTGAGDSVLAMLSAAIANSISLSEATELANIAGAVAIEQLGCARVALTDIAMHMVLQPQNKLFTEEHTRVLQHALENRPYTELRLVGGTKADIHLLKRIRALKAESGKDLLVSVEEHDEELVDTLTALRDVDFVHVAAKPMGQAPLFH